MRILPVNTNQNRSNQPNFQARTLQIGHQSWVGEMLGNVSLVALTKESYKDEGASRHMYNKVIGWKVVLKARDGNSNLRTIEGFKGKREAIKLYCRLRDAVDTATHTDGKLIDFKINLPKKAESKKGVKRIQK